MSGSDSTSAWHRRQEHFCSTYIYICKCVFRHWIQWSSSTHWGSICLIHKLLKNPILSQKSWNVPPLKSLSSHFSYPATSPTSKSWIMSLSPQPPYSLASNKLCLCSISAWSFYQFQEGKEASLGHRKKVAQMTFLSINNGKYIVDPHLQTLRWILTLFSLRGHIEAIRRSPWSCLHNLSTIQAGLTLSTDPSPLGCYTGLETYPLNLLQFSLVIPPLRQCPQWPCSGSFVQ